MPPLPGAAARSAHFVDFKDAFEAPLAAAQAIEASRNYIRKRHILTGSEGHNIYFGGYQSSTRPAVAPRADSAGAGL
jgi:hypothetical protein